jgi:hypothetical protein
MLGLAAAVAIAIVLIATAGAGAKPVGVRKIDLSTRAAVAKYLHKLGVNPKGVVIQRGRHNYAGPNCPGRGWTCTTSRRVVQVAGGNGDNKFECTPSEGGTSAPPDTCVIVQGTGKHDMAKCREEIHSSDPAPVAENCTIVQGGTDNNADIDMLIVQTGSPNQQASQSVTVDQDGTGHNDSHVKALVQQQIDSNGAAAGSTTAVTPASISQHQNVQQTIDVGQHGFAPVNNDSHVDSNFKQTAMATNGANVTQRQNDSGQPNGDVTVDQDSNGGKNDSHLNIDGASFANAKNNTGLVMQTQGSPTGGLDGHSDQFSSFGEGAPSLLPSFMFKGSSRLDATIHETMHATADQAAVQEQHGPTFCCSQQFGNPQQDGEKIREDVDLQTSSVPTEQTDLNTLDCHSDNLANGCNGRIRANVNGNVGMADCANNASPCSIGVFCTTVGTDSTGACVPVSCDNLADGETNMSCPDPCTLSPSAPGCQTIERDMHATYARRE